MSKRGDIYLRTLLVHGARSVILAAERKTEQAATWLGQLLKRRNENLAAVALANKNARIVWTLLAHERKFLSDYRPAAAAFMDSRTDAESVPRNRQVAGPGHSSVLEAVFQ